MKTLLMKVHLDRKALQHSIDDLRARIPKPLAASFQHPNKAEAIGQLITRFPVKGVSGGDRS